MSGAGASYDERRLWCQRNRHGDRSRRCRGRGPGPRPIATGMCRGPRPPRILFRDRSPARRHGRCICPARSHIRRRPSRTPAGG
jgi:hypothetical protein